MTLEGKTAVLETEGTEDSADETPITTEITEKVSLKNGMHARPATELSRLLESYDGKIEMAFKRHNGFYLEAREKCEDPTSKVYLIACSLLPNSEVYLTFTGEKPSEEFREELHDVFNNNRYNSLLS